MLKFTARNLAAPKQLRPVYIVAAGQSDFRRCYPEKKTEELCIEAFRMMALENALKVEGIQELKGYIHSCFYGHFADHFGDQLLGESAIHDRLGLDPMGNVGIKTSGATGGSTLWMAANAIASGYSDCVLAMGWERMDEVDAWTGRHTPPSADDSDFEADLAHLDTGYYSAMARRYATAFGQTHPSFRRTLSKIAVKNHGYACSNPFAQAPARLSVEEVESSPIVSDPLRSYDACLMSVGASCVLLCDEATAYALSDDPIRFWIASGSHSLHTLDRRHLDIPLLPNERDNEDIARLYLELLGGDSGTVKYPRFTGYLAARMAAHYAYEMTGVNDPCADLDLVELHDAFTISELQTCEDIGIRPYGSGSDYIESGDAYLGGRLPANLSGGLIGCMHAPGATGIMQVAEVLWQLQQRWSHFHEREELWTRFGKTKPADFVNLQVPDAKRGLAISHAGVGAHVTCSILMRPSAVIRG